MAWSRWWFLVAIAGPGLLVCYLPGGRMMLLGHYAAAVGVGAVGIVLRGLPVWCGAGATGLLRWTGRCCLIFACLLVSTGTAAVERGGHSGLPLDSVCRVRGRLLDDGTPLSTGDTVRYALGITGVASEIAEVSADGKVMLFLSGHARLGWGRVVEVETSVLPDRSNDQSSSGGLGVAWAESGDVRDLGWIHHLFEYRHLVREQARRAIDQAGAPVSGLMTALLLGARDDIGKVEYETFRAAGCAHVLALSGMHLGILVMAIGWLFGILLGKRVGLLCVVPIVVCFVILVGPKASLIRATIMFLLAAGFRLLSLRPYPLHVLGLSFAIFVVCDPAVTVDLSFQLSYLALFGLLAFGRSIGGLVRQIIPIRPIAEAVGYSIGAWICTAPLSIATFGATYPVGILSGLIVTPLVTVFIWCGVASIFLGRLPRYSISFILRRLRALLDSITGVAASAPSIRTPSALAVFYCILGAVLLAGYLLRRRRLNIYTTRRHPWSLQSTTIHEPKSDGFSPHVGSECRNDSAKISSSPDRLAN